MESGGTKMTLSIKSWSEDGEAKIPIPNSFFLVFSRKCTAIAVDGVNMDIFFFVNLKWASHRIVFLDHNIRKPCILYASKLLNVTIK